MVRGERCGWTADGEFDARCPVAALNQLWVADITDIPTRRATLYLAVVLDVWSRRIVGWGMEPHLRTSLVLAALDRASALDYEAPIVFKQRAMQAAA